MNRHIEKAYQHLPTWGQNLAISAFGLYYRNHRLGGSFAEHAEQFRARDRWPPDRLAEHVTGALRRTLIRAFTQVPYYRSRWRELGIQTPDLTRFSVSDLPRLPIVPKDDLRRDCEAFVADDRRGRSALTRNPSSGSTGTPVTSIWSADDRRKFIACREARSFNWAGVSTLWSRSMIGGRMVVPEFGSQPPFHRYNFAEKQVYFSAYHIRSANVPSYVEGFNKYRPRVFTGYAHSHYFIARAMLEQGLTLDYRPDALVLGSEKLSSDMRQIVEQAFGARVHEEYGSVENCLLATECEEGRLHVSPDFGIVELVDDDGRAVPPGTPGRVLGTGLLNESQPLIRYEIGDLATWSAERCPCGRDQFPVLESVLGRLEDIVVGPDGREMVRFHGLFVEIPNLVEAQVIQEKVDFIRIRVVATDGFSQPEEEEIKRRLRTRLGGVRAVVERVPEIERTARGKFRAVVSKLSREEKDRCRRGAGTIR